MRLLSIGSVDMSHGGKTTGGVARLHSLLTKTWVNNPNMGIEVVGIIATNSEVPADPVTEIPYLSRLPGESQPDALSRIIDEYNPDCILLHHIATGWGWAIQKISNLPKIIGFVHSWRVTWEKYDPNYPKKLDIAKSSIKFIDSLLYLSNHCANEMKQFDIYPDSTVHILPPPVEVSDIGLDKINNSRKNKHVIFLGNLLDHKNILALLEAIYHLTDFNLTVIGSGKLDDEVQQYVESNNLQNRVNITGFLPDSEISDILLTGDIFCAPSSYEPFGLVYIEALAHGLPVIGYGPSIQEIQDYVGIKCGVALSHFDYKTIQQSILEVSATDWNRSQLHNVIKSAYSPIDTAARFANSMID